MIGGFRFNVKELKEMPMKNRLMLNLIRYKGEEKFYVKANEILRERQPKDTDEWDKEVVARIRIFNRNISECIATYSLLKDLYRSEYDDYYEMEKLIDAISDDLSEKNLVSTQWKEKETK